MAPNGCKASVQANRVSIALTVGGGYGLGRSCNRPMNTINVQNISIAVLKVNCICNVDNPCAAPEGWTRTLHA